MPHLLSIRTPPDARAYALWYICGFCQLRLRIYSENRKSSTRNSPVECRNPPMFYRNRKGKIRISNAFSRNKNTNLY